MGAWVGVAVDGGAVAVGFRVGCGVGLVPETQADKANNVTKSENMTLFIDHFSSYPSNARPRSIHPHRFRHVNSNPDQVLSTEATL